MVEAVVEKMKSIGTQQCGLEWVRFLRSRSSVGRNSIRNSKGERSCFERCRHTTTDPILRIATVRQPWRRLVVVDATAFSTTHLQGTPPSEKSLGVIRPAENSRTSRSSSPTCSSSGRSGTPSGILISTRYADTYARISAGSRRIPTVQTSRNGWTALSGSWRGDWCTFNATGRRSKRTICG